MILKVLLRSVKNVLMNHIVFWLMILSLHQVILQGLERTILTYNNIMMIDDQIKDKKLQLDINREVAKISALSSGKIDKYKYLTGEEILPSNRQQIIQQAKFTNSVLGKAFKKQKTIEDQREKQIKAIKDQRHVKTIKKYDYFD